MLLYNSSVSGNCYKVRLLAAQLGIPLELRELDLVNRSNRPDVLGGLNPALRVPTLILEGGRPLGESNAIITYLADGTDYYPTERYERAQVHQWFGFEQYDHEPNIAVSRFWALFDVDPGDELRAMKRAGSEKALAAMDDHLKTRTFLVGERYTIADISLYAYTHVAHEAGFDMSRYPALAPWLDRVAAQPGHILITD